MLGQYSTRGKPVQVNLVEGTRGVSSSMSIMPESGASRTDPLNSHLVELARTIQTADEFVKSNATNKLTVIVDQIRYLQEQAKKVLEDAQTDHLLHHAACNFNKTPGNIYYLYERESGQRYFSMLAPDEWGPSCPHTFHGSYRLEYDMSWTPAAKMEARSKDLDLFEKVFAAQNALTDSSILQSAVGAQGVFSEQELLTGSKHPGSSKPSASSFDAVPPTPVMDPHPTVTDEDGNVIKPMVTRETTTVINQGNGGEPAPCGRKRQYDVRTPSESETVTGK